MCISWQEPGHVERSSALPYSHYASIMIRSPGDQCYYRISCGAISSEVYSFHSWRLGNTWSPHITIIGGPVSKGVTDTLHSNPKLSLITHIAGAEAANRDTYMGLIQPMAAAIPFLLVPARVNQSDSRFPLPGVEWPIRKDTFHTVLGPIIVVGFNSHKLKESVAWLKDELADISLLREKHPWLILFSQEPLFCVTRSAPQPIECQQLFNLLSQHKVDLYISGSSPGYQRSWPIAHDGSALSSYHNSQGFVYLGLGIRQGNLNSARLNLPSVNIMKTLNQVEETLVDIVIEGLTSLCLKIENSKNQMVVDHFCIDKKVHLETMISGSSYDMTTWICLITILSAVFLVSLMFRRTLYAKVCKYMEADGRSPLYRGSSLLPA